MYLTVNNTKLFFDVYGSELSIKPDRIESKPTIIVLHGGHGFADHIIYVEFWSQFADIAQVIFLDQRGCGRSDLSEPDKWNLQQWADDLYEFCIALNISKPIIAGVSMGGHVMCEFISKHYDYPGGLIFCNTEAKYDLEAVCEKFEKLGGEKPSSVCRNFYKNPTQQALNDYIKYCIPYYAKNAYSKKELDRCIKHPEVFLHYCRHQMLKFNYLNEMHKITCPSLLLVGEDSLHLPEFANQMATKINPEYVTMKVFKNAGAPVYKDNPKEAYSAIKNFLLKKQIIT